LYAAHEELLTSEICWWRFDEARLTASATLPVAERVGTSAQARFSCLRAALAYLLGQLEAAVQAVNGALKDVDLLRRRGDTASPDLGSPLPLISFAAHYQQGAIAAARSSWSEVFDAVKQCKLYQEIIPLPRYANAVTLLETDALLGRGETGDAERARALAETLAPGVPQGLFGWSDSAELARARIAARLRRQNARAALRTALDAIEEQARRMPLDCDRAFARLADAADEVDESGIRDRARTRSAYYAATRTAAAPALSLPGTASLRR
jgi:hypothetical protein